jgi:hypothetical protein
MIGGNVPELSVETFWQLEMRNICTRNELSSLFRNAGGSAR